MLTLARFALLLVFALPIGNACALAIDFSTPQPLRTDAATESDNDTDARMVSSANGSLVVIWAAQIDTGGFEVRVARSVDGGASWSPPVTLDADLSERHSSRFPRLATDGAGTWIAVWSLRDADDEVYTVRSTDDGITWTDAAPLRPGAGDSFAVQGIATDGSGTWIVLDSMDDPGPPSTNHPFGVSRSVDGGVTWLPPVPLVTAPIPGYGELAAEVVADGQGGWLAVLWANHLHNGQYNDNVLFTRSNDGTTWSPPVVVETDVANFIIDQNPRVASDGAGRLVVVWTRLRPNFGDQAMSSTSLDGGLTWSAPKSVNIHHAEGEYIGDDVPDIVSDGRGAWFAGWYNRPFGRPSSMLVARSIDAGATWSEPTVIIPEIEGNDCGYYDNGPPLLATVGQGTLVALWQRGLNFCPQPPERPDNDLFTAHAFVGCGNGILDAGEECDDGNVLPLDGCSPDCEFEPCRAQIVADCQPAATAKASLRLTNRATRQLEWKWGRGAVTAAELGDPTQAGDDYYFCVYDGGALLSQTKVSGGAACGNRSCWDPTPTGYEFRQTIRRPKSTILLQLRQGTNGRSRLHFRARSSTVALPVLPATGPLDVQLRRPAGSVCWSARFSSPYYDNEPSHFFAQSD